MIYVFPLLARGLETGKGSIRRGESGCIIIPLVEHCTEERR